jgi:hypothetical protein
MTVVNSKEFKAHQDKYLRLALSERVFIKRGNNTLFITAVNNESLYDDEDLIDAKACENDETVSGADFIKLFT